jgi:hypothetical protein
MIGLSFKDPAKIVIMEAFEEGKGFDAFRKVDDEADVPRQEYFISLFLFSHQARLEIILLLLEKMVVGNPQLHFHPFHFLVVLYTSTVQNF